MNSKKSNMMIRYCMVLALIAIGVLVAVLWNMKEREGSAANGNTATENETETENEDGNDNESESGNKNENGQEDSSEEDTNRPSAWTITQYGDANGNQHMFYTIQSDTGSLVVIDGGFREEADFVRETIKSLGGKVDCWILTHPHNDHIGAFNQIYADPAGIEIGQIYTTYIDQEKYRQKAQPWDTYEMYEEFLALTKDAENVAYLYQGDRLEVAGLKMSVFNAYHDYVDQVSGDLANDGSLMFRLEGNAESMLFCADVGISMSDSLVQKYGGELKSDYLQIAHHGNGGLNDEFYRLVSPKKVFFDAPDWLMNNQNPSTLETAGYDTPENRKLMEELGAEICSFSTAPNSIVLR